MTLGLLARAEPGDGRVSSGWVRIIPVITQPIRPVGAGRGGAGRQQETLEILKFDVGCAAMITTAQIRAGRGLLKWTQATLAHRAAISAVTLNMIENETVKPRASTLGAIQRALERAGVQMVEEDGLGVGVRFAAGLS